MLSFCKDHPSLIENYDKAVSDSTRVWIVHHCLETHKYKDRARKEWVRRDEDIGVEMLKVFGLYYQRPASELIFMTKSEHVSLHRKGKKHSDKARQLIREKRAKQIMVPHPVAPEIRKKISETVHNNPTAMGYKAKELSKLYHQDNKGLSWNEFQNKYKEII